MITNEQMKTKAPDLAVFMSLQLNCRQAPAASPMVQNMDLLLLQYRVQSHAFQNTLQSMNNNVSGDTQNVQDLANG